VPVGHINLHELSVDRVSASLIYPFITKDGTLGAPKTVSLNNFNAFAYGDIISGSYPLSSTITKDFYDGSDRARVVALRNTLDYYVKYSKHFYYSASAGLAGEPDDSDGAPTAGWLCDKSSQDLGLLSIPSIFYGSSIKKGTINLKFFVTGTLIGELKDENRDGELIQVGPPGSTGSGSVAGVALYNEGFLVLTGSWPINTNTESYTGGSATTPKWAHFAQSISGSVTATSSSFFLGFDGTNYIETITMLAHAPRGELNHSNNPTYIKYSQTGSTSAVTSSLHYAENKNLLIKNTVSSAYYDHTASFEKQTFISKVAIYDKDKNLIAIAKLANPVKKVINRDFTFKLKLDI